MDDPEQSRAFIEAARELGCDDSREAFERIVRKVARQGAKPAKPKEGKE